MKILILPNSGRITIYALVCVLAAGSPAKGLRMASGFAMQSESKTSCVTRVVSDPPGGEVSIDGGPRSWVAPVELELDAGRHAIEVQLAGHLTLKHEFEAVPGEDVELRFVLLREQPEQLSPEDLGLRYEELAPIIPEESAVTTLEKFLGLAELFSVLPLGAGLSLKVADRAEEHADVLIITGLTLTVASYTTGKWLASRRLREIRAENARLQDLNSTAKIHNSAVEQQLRDRFQEEMSVWEAEALSRGNVTARPLR